MPRLAHHVFFTLEDASETRITGLVAACKKYLVDHDGVIDFAVGRRDPELNRPVNAHYHVSLHVIFRNRETHDAYQTAAMHLEFIDQEKANWKQVQVFDSTLE
jgi:Stress responsive A/B Barrel Domain